jgi:hypothetical protein
MPPAQVQLTGGNFQDSEGSPLVLGYLKLQLSQDAVVNSQQICSGIEITINLDAGGSALTGQYVWGNDQLAPINTYYRVTGYKANGQPAWGPNNQQIIGNGGTFDLGTWVPNAILSWSPSPQPITFQTNEVNNGSQLLLDLHAGTGITLVDNGVGRVTITAPPVTSLTLKTNGTANGSQTLLNLKNGTGVSVVDDGVGGVTLNNTAIGIGGVGVSANVPRVGDILAYNVYGDNLWDVTGAIPRGLGYQCDGLNSTAQPYGSASTGVGLGSFVLTAATATESATLTSVASTPQIGPAVGVQFGYSGGTSHYSIGTIRRFVCRARVNSAVANTRYWIGFGEFQFADTSYVTNTPNHKYVSFRLSNGVDGTTWAAVSGTDNTHQTVVSTGVAVDTTNSQLFEIVVSGINAYFYINGTLVANISTNVPAAATLVGHFAGGDNNNLSATIGMSNWVGFFLLKT